MAKNLKKETESEMTLEQLAKLLQLESKDVKLHLDAEGWSLQGKSINDYRALKRLITKGEK